MDDERSMFTARLQGRQHSAAGTTDRARDRHGAPALLRSRDRARARAARARRHDLNRRPRAYPRPWRIRSRRRSCSPTPASTTIAPGDVVMVRCDVVMTNDISGPIAFRTMREMGVDRVFDPDAGRAHPRPLRAGQGRALGGAPAAAEGLGRRAGRRLLRAGARRHRAPGAGRGRLGGARLRGRRRRLAHLHARRARARSAPASAPPTSPAAWPSASSGRSCRGRSRWSSRGDEGPLGVRQGPDPRRAGRDRRQRRHRQRAGVRRRRAPRR